MDVTSHWSEGFQWRVWISGSRIAVLGGPPFCLCCIFWVPDKLGNPYYHKALHEEVVMHQISSSSHPNKSLLVASF